jgi:hypothetical protein
MSTYAKIVEYMTEKLPDEAKIVDGPVTYNSTQHTHQSFSRYLMAADRTSQVYRIYLLRCYDWLKLLKKHEINLQIKNK